MFFPPLARELEHRHEELASLNAQPKQLATQDALTSLDNRRVYNREIDIHLALFHRAKLPFALILADIDWFKEFNDRFDHDAGDRVLQEVSQCPGLAIPLANALEEMDRIGVKARLVEAARAKSEPEQR